METPQPSSQQQNKILATLFIYVNPKYPELVAIYKEAVDKHNRKAENKYPDSGFDLYLPEEEVFENSSDDSFSSKMVNFQLKTEMKCTVYAGKDGYFDRSKAFYLYARSSISKTPLMLANHVGVVDSGYRGDLIGAFRCFPLPLPYVVEKHTRLVQICLPSLDPFRVEMVADLSELSGTERGEGGFGSTGK